jgi:hypothetical protein
MTAQKFVALELISVIMNGFWVDTDLILNKRIE